MFQRLYRPLAAAVALGFPAYLLADGTHRRAIARQGGSRHAIAAPTPAPVPEPEGEAPVAFNPSHYPKGLNAGFLNRTKEEVVAFYGPKFEVGEARDIAAHQDYILDAIGDLSGKTVVDIGSGTGFFLKKLSQRVTATGHVVATDLAPSMCERIADRISEEGLDNAVVFQSSEKALNVPNDTKADVAFICDVYHHLTYPKTFMKDVHDHLADGGRLVLIDFFRDPSKMFGGPHAGQWVLDHVRADKDTFQKEIEEAGFELQYDVDGVITGLTENYMLIFTKK